MKAPNQKVEPDRPTSLPLGTLRAVRSGDGEDQGGGEYLQFGLRLLLVLPVFSHRVWHVKPPAEYSYTDRPAGYHEPASQRWHSKTYPSRFHFMTPYRRRLF